MTFRMMFVPFSGTCSGNGTNIVRLSEPQRGARRIDNTLPFSGRRAEASHCIKAIAAVKEPIFFGQRWH